MEQIYNGSSQVVALRNHVLRWIGPGYRRILSLSHFPSKRHRTWYRFTHPGSHNHLRAWRMWIDLSWRWLPSHKIVQLLQEKATLLEHAKDVAASLSIEALVILFWHGCWSLLDEWSASIGLDQPSLELDGELDYTISSWYAVVSKMQAM